MIKTGQRTHHNDIGEVASLRLYFNSQLLCLLRRSIARLIQEHNRTSRWKSNMTNLRTQKNT
eukprot:6327386-Amphidinium_carterae.1